MAVRYFGIRHHGPGSARSLEAALDDWQPDGEVRDEDEVLADTPARLHRIRPEVLASQASQNSHALAIFHELMARTMAERIAFQNRQPRSQ